MQTVPKVSIGMPVYNGADNLRIAIDSLLAQDFDDWEIIIVDNDSKDDTEQIARTFVSGDSRISYHRNETNLGSIANFSKALRLSSGDMFMWAAHDDTREKEFISSNYGRITKDDSVVGSVSQVRFDEDGEFVDAPAGTFPLMGSVGENVVAYLQRPEANSRFYGLMRRTALLQSMNESSMWGWDWLVIVKLLRFGKFDEVPERLMTRRLRGESSSVVDAIRSVNKPGMGRVFPLAPMTIEALKLGHVPKSASLLKALMKHNITYAATMVRGN